MAEQDPRHPTHDGNILDADTEKPARHAPHEHHAAQAAAADITPQTNPLPPVPQPPAAQATPADESYKTLGIISICLPFVGLAAVGLVLGIIGLNKAKQNKQETTLPVIGIVISSIFIFIWLLIFMFALTGSFFLNRVTPTTGY